VTDTLIQQGYQLMQDDATTCSKVRRCTKMRDWVQLYARGHEDTWLYAVVCGAAL